MYIYTKCLKLFNLFDTISNNEIISYDSQQFLIF